MVAACAKFRSEQRLCGYGGRSAVNGGELTLKTFYCALCAISLHRAHNLILWIVRLVVDLMSNITTIREERIMSEQNQGNNVNQ